MKIALIDYNAGNTKSVINTLKRLGIEPDLTADPAKIMAADKVILPGVGHAGSAMKELYKRDLVQVLKAVKQPFLGVCVGMQLMVDWSEEGDTTCLGLIPGQIRKFKSTQEKVPQIGWNTVKHNGSHIFKGIPQDAYFYFVHSFYLPTNVSECGQCHYIEDFTAAIHQDNYYGVQFHPEKSAKWGEQLIKNFLEL